MENEDQPSYTSYSPTRWWSKFQVMHHIHDCLKDVKTFLHDGSLELPVTTTRKMLEILDDEARCRKLKIEVTTVYSRDRSHFDATPIDNAPPTFN